MRKLLGSTLALALLVPTGANAELLKNFKAGGSLEVADSAANNVSDLNTVTYDRLSTVQTRLMVHGDWDLLDDVHAHVSVVKNDRTYGTASQDLNTIQTALFVRESYVKIDKLFGALDATVGRQYYGEPGDMVIYYGPKYNLYGLAVTPLDGGRFDWNGESVGVTALAAKVTGSALGVTDAGNVNLRGIDVHVKPAGSLSGSGYLYQRVAINSGSFAHNVIGEDYRYVLGFRGKWKSGGAWASAEIDKNFGARRIVAAAGPYSAVGNYTGWAGKANGGYKADLELGVLAGWLEAGIGSGGQTLNRNFTPIAGDYRPGSIAGRFASVAPVAGAPTAVDEGSLSNRVVFGTGVKATPSALKKLTAGLSWWNFRVQNATALHNVSPTDTKGNKFLGNEYDLDLTWTHSENVTISAGVGTFQPGNVYASTNAGGLSQARAGYADLAIKF